MDIYHYHPETGVFLGHGQADESPLEPGVWLIPAHATTEQPLEPGDNEQVVWRGTSWQLQPIPEPIPEPEPEPQPDPTPASVDFLRRIAFTEESDPLYFKAQRGEATMDEWLAKVEEIRLRYPNLAQ